MFQVHFSSSVRKVRIFITISIRNSRESNRDRYLNMSSNSSSSFTLLKMVITKIYDLENEVRSLELINPHSLATERAQVIKSNLKTLHEEFLVHQRYLMPDALTVSELYALTSLGNLIENKVVSVQTILSEQFGSLN